MSGFFAYMDYFNGVHYRGFTIFANEDIVGDENIPYYFACRNGIFDDVLSLTYENTLVVYRQSRLRDGFIMICDTPKQMETAINTFYLAQNKWGDFEV